MAIDTPTAEPEFFVLPAWSSGVAERPPQQAVPGTAITHLRLGTPNRISSHAAHWAGSTGLLSVETAAEHVLTITFDHASRLQKADLRPALPVVLCW
jgi:hypothetical protein